MAYSSENINSLYNERIVSTDPSAAANPLYDFANLYVATSGYSGTSDAVVGLMWVDYSLVMHTPTAVND